MSDPWLKFYPTDWRSDPALRMCSMAARGLWIEMIALMHEATPYGHLLVSGRSPTDAQLAVLVGAPSDQIPELLGELDAAGVFSRTREGVIYSRKMTRTAKKAAIARKNGKNGGNPALSKERENPPSDNLKDKGKDKPQKPEARSQIEGEAKASLFDDGPQSPAFSDFWAAWPLSKNAKKNAEAAFKKLSAQDRIAATECAAAWADDWLRRHPHANHIHPATYLNARRWTDEGQPTLTIIHGSSNDRQSPQQNRQSAADDRFGRVADAAIRNRAPSSADFGFR